MTFSTRLSGNPEFDISLNAAPLAIQLGGEASLALNSGPVSADVGPVPIRMRVPFMPGYVEVASIGPFGVKLHEINAAVRVFGVDFGGVIGGEEGINCDLAGEVRCCMQVDMNGKLPGKVVEAVINAVLEE